MYNEDKKLITEITRKNNMDGKEPVIQAARYGTYNGF